MLVICDTEVTHNAGVVRDRAGAQPGHTFPETGGHSSSPEDTEPAEFEFRRIVADPKGHARTHH